jgi:hypothetical protein
MKINSLSFVCLGILLLLACQKDASSTLSSNIQGHVLEEGTEKPLPGSIVYYGSQGSPRCTSDKDGFFSLTIQGYGEFYVGVYKKGFKSNGMHLNVKKGEIKKVNFYLSPTEKKPLSIRVKGKLIVDKELVGTRSENRYFKLLVKNSEPLFIFDEIGNNRPFSKAAKFHKFVGKDVVVSGYLDQGSIGWQGLPQKGIFVESIDVD